MSGGGGERRGEGTPGPHPRGLAPARGAHARARAWGLGLLLAAFGPTPVPLRADEPIDGFVKGERVFSATLTVGARESSTGIQGDGAAVYVVHVEGAATSPGGRAFDALYQHGGPGGDGALPARSPRIEVRAGSERVYRDFEPYAAEEGQGARLPAFREDHVYEFLWRPKAGGPIAVVSPPMTFDAPPTDTLRGEFQVSVFRAIRDEGRPSPKEPVAPASPKEPVPPVPQKQPDPPTAAPRGPRLAPGELSGDEWVGSALGTGRMSLEKDLLVLSLGPEDDGTRCWSRVAIEGDFDLTVTYALLDWAPGPRQSPSLDLYVSEEANITPSTMQVSRADFEDAKLVFVQPGTEPTPTKDRTDGRFRVRREGDSFTVWQGRGAEDAPLAKVERRVGASTWIGFGLTKGGDGTLKVALRPSWTASPPLPEGRPSLPKPPANPRPDADLPSLPATEGPSIVGTWEWSPPTAGASGPTGLLVFASDRSVAGGGGKYGTWVQDGRTVVVRWSRGAAPLTLLLSDDGRTLTGRDASGASLRATRKP